MTLVEGTFIPIPSEITLIPAGYLIAKQQLNLWYVLLWSTLGTVAGALLSYYIALHFGRNLLIKYGKYILVHERQLKYVEIFFAKNGAISAFVGRILPGVKHFISIPAGLGKMDLKLFVIYSTAGAIVWIAFLLAIGYFIGGNEVLISKCLNQLNIIAFSAILLILIWYLLKAKYKNRNK